MLYRFFRDEHSPSEAEIIGNWLEENPRHQETFRRTFQAFQAEQMLLKPRERRPVRIWHGLGAAAAAAAVFAAGFIVNRETATKPALERIDNLISQVAVQETLPGNRALITLPDGSLVHLSADSHLEYFSVYEGGERRVKLRGEAMFEVQSNPDCPFVVETSHYEIVATGTCFNVSSDLFARQFSTTLIRGIVDVRNTQGETLFRLEPGQEAYWRPEGLAVRSLEDAEETILWAKGIISVSGVPFDALMKTFERCFGVRIAIDTPNIPTIHYGLAKVRISNGVEYALKVLQRRSDFNYRYDELTQTYHIY